MTPKYKIYAQATDDFLFELVCKYNPNGPTDLLSFDVPLYNEITSRKTVRSRLTLSRGWRRGVEDWNSYKLSDWLSLCEQFSSAAAFTSSYAAAKNAVCKSQLWPEVRKLMVKSGKWSDQLYGRDYRRYDSRPELIVADWLHCSKIDYIYHPPLKLKETHKPFVGDFQIPMVANIEVFMLSKGGRRSQTDLPSWAEAYLVTRQKKECYYEKEVLPLTSIEAEIYQKNSPEKFLDHVRYQFKKLNINLCDLDNLQIGYSQHDLGIKLALEDFINYAQSNDIFSISQYQLDAPDLYAQIHINDLAKDVRIKLDMLNGRRSIAYKEDLRPIEDVRADCLRLGITERSQYENAYQKGLFLIDTPYSILQSYGVPWFEFINGRKIDNFWSWEVAKKFVRSFIFKSKTEFERYPRRGGDWDFIRKSPAAPSGGYPEWTDWGDFLGNVDPKEQERIKADIEITSKLINEFKALNTKASVFYLKKLGLHNTKLLNKTRGRLYEDLQRRPDWIELRDMLAARIPKVKTPSEAIEILILEQCFYLSDFVSERDSKPNLQRIPKHPDRIGKGIFALVRKTVGLPAHDVKIRSSLR